jgi:hypothetical protein
LRQQSWALLRVAAEEQEATKKYPDYQESIAKLRPDGASPLPPTVYCHLMMNVENPTDVAYHLSKNPEALTKLWALEAQGAGVRVIEEVNKISHGLSFRSSAHQQRQAAASAAQRQSSPQPLRHIGGRGYTGTSDIRDPNMPYSQYKQIMNERERGRR